MKYAVLLCLMLLSLNAHASRLMEIEDYYSQKTTEFIKTRYPRTAFSVYVQLEAEETPQTRKLASNQRSESLALPYFEAVNTTDVQFWERKDLSMGKLITYLRSVFIKIDIENDFTESEKEEFKAALFKYLKLSETYDRISIKESQWQATSSWGTYQPLVLFGLLGLILLGGAIFFAFRSGMAQLISGLAQPLSEIGKSAESVANSSNFGVESQNSFQMANKKWEEEALPIEELQQAKADIQKITAYLRDPDAELINKIEELGEKDPFSVGAIFSEMPVSDLAELVRWGRGSWWRIAITQVTPINHHSTECLNEFSQLYMRKNLIGKEISEKETQVRRVLARLEEKQFGELLKSRKFTEAQAILKLLPHEMMIVVAKYLYPGQWADLLDDQESKSLPDSELSQIEKQALTLCPLKSAKEVAEYFKEADLLSLLDRSSTKDEREIYRVLSDKSTIKNERRAFYSVFQESKATLEKLTNDLPLEVWALALASCDRKECETIYSFFNSKQKFILRNYKDRFVTSKPRESEMIAAKKRILFATDQILSYQEQSEFNESASDAAA